MFCFCIFAPESTPNKNNQNMMTTKTLTACLLLALGLLASCIREEALNTEADIVGITLPGEVMNRDAMFGDAVKLANGTSIYPIILYLKRGVNTDALAPELTLTEGATVDPPSGTVRDFSEPQTYTVTSQDGQWTRTYLVSATTSSLTTTHYSFEHVRLGGAYEQYHVFYEPEIDWASGNPGYALADLNERNPLNFPTYQGTDGWRNNCLILQTRNAGSLAASVNMPIASGNLFLGSFNINDALQNALTATQFGLPFDRVPVRLTGYYKYTPGDTFYELDTSRPDKLRPVPDRQDRFDIYAVLYESTDDRPILDATNILSADNPQVISVAQISPDDAKPADLWTPFELTFQYREGKRVDYDKLSEGLYNLAIVFASSERGAYFEGAPGSTLYIDEVDLICED